MASSAAELSILIKADASDVEKKLRGAGDKIKGLGGNLTKLGAPAIGAAGAIAGIGIASVKAAGEFQTQMKQVATLGADFGKPFGEVEQDVSKLAKTMGLDAVDSANALYNAVSAGVPADNALSFLEQAGKAAVAGGAELSDVGSVMATVMNSWGEAAGGATDITDKLFQTINMGVTTMPELAANMGNIGATASALGVDFDQTSAALAQVTTLLPTTAQSTTALKGAMAELMTPTSKSSKALEEMGYANSQAAIEALGFQGTLEALEKHAQNAGVGVNTLFGSVEAGTAVLALTGDNVGAANEKLAAMADVSGNTQAALDKVNQGWQRQVDLLKSQVTGTLREIGLALLPSLTTALQDAMPAIQELAGRAAEFGKTLADNLPGAIEAVREKFDELKPTIDKVIGFLSEHKGTILKIVAAFGALSAVAAVVGPPLMAIGMLISGLAPVFGILGSIIGTIVTVVGGAAGAMTILGAAFTVLTGPIGIAVAAVIGIIAAMKLLHDNQEAIKAKIKEVWDAITSGISGKLDEIKTAVSDAWSAVSDAISGALGFITSAIRLGWDAMLRNISDKLDAILGAVTTAWDAVSEAIDTTLETVKDVIGRAFNFLRDLIDTALQGWQSIIDRAMGAIQTAVDNVFGENTGISVVVKTAADFIHGILDTLRLFVSGDFAGAWTALKTTVSEAWDGLKKAVRVSVANVKAKVQELLDKIGKFAGIDLVAVGKAIFDGLATGIGRAEQAVKNAVTLITDKLPQWVRDILGIGSPSRVFMEIGGEMAKGLSLGFTKGMKEFQFGLPPLLRDVVSEATRVIRGAFGGNYFIGGGRGGMLAPGGAGIIGGSAGGIGGVGVAPPGGSAGGAGGAGMGGPSGPLGPGGLRSDMGGGAGLGGVTRRRPVSASAFRSGRGGFLAASKANYWRKFVDKWGIPDQKTAEATAKALGIPLPDWLKTFYAKTTVGGATPPRAGELPGGGGAFGGGGMFGPIGPPLTGSRIRPRRPGMRGGLGRFGPGWGGSRRGSMFGPSVGEPGVLIGEFGGGFASPGPPIQGGPGRIPPPMKGGPGKTPPIYATINVNLDGQTLEVLFAKAQGSSARNDTVGGQGG